MLNENGFGIQICCRCGNNDSNEYIYRKGLRHLATRCTAAPPPLSLSLSHTHKGTLCCSFFVHQPSLPWQKLGIQKKQGFHGIYNVSQALSYPALHMTLFTLQNALTSVSTSGIVLMHWTHMASHKRSPEQ